MLSRVTAGDELTSSRNKGHVTQRFQPDDRIQRWRFWGKVRGEEWPETFTEKEDPEYVMWGMVLGKQHQEMSRFWLQGEGLNIYCCSPTPKIPATLLPGREGWGSDMEFQCFLKTLSWFSCSSPHQHHLHFQKRESVSCKVMSNSLRPHELYSPPGFSVHRMSRQEHWSQ